jgi:hypothetical protein
MEEKKVVKLLNTKIEFPNIKELFYRQQEERIKEINAWEKDIQQIFQKKEQSEN